MGKSKKKNVNKQEAKTEILNQTLKRNQSAAKKGNRNFRNFYDFSRRPESYETYASYANYTSFSAWPRGNPRAPRGNHSSNTRPYRTKPCRKSPSRPVSPVLGSEEYMVRKIQQTSAIIMRQLLNPDEQIIDDSQTLERSEGESSKSTCEQHTKICEKPAETVSSKNKSKRVNNYNIEEIQKKILNHITNLNNGRKKNLINSDISGYDAAIQQIQKQKRLEISRALRDMCSKSNQTQESSDLINSIIPDMGIKIEDLPRDLIEELRNTLNLDLDYRILEDTGYYSAGGFQSQEGNILNTNLYFVNDVIIPEATPVIRIKPEPIDKDKLPLFTEDGENYNEIKESNDRKGHDTNTRDNIGNLWIQQEADSENVLNTFNNSRNETVPDVTSVKLEPKDVVINVIEISDDEDQESLDTKNNENIAFKPVTIKREIENEATRVETTQPEVGVNLNSEKNDSCDSRLLFTADKKNQSAITLDNTERSQNHIAFTPVTVKQEIEDETRTSQHEVTVNLNSEKNYPFDSNFLFTADKDQSEMTLDNTERNQNGTPVRPVTIKQEIESETSCSHVETSQPELSVHLNSERNDPGDCNFLFTADKNQSEMTLHNTERNQSDIAIRPVTIRQEIESETSLDTSQPEVIVDLNSDKNDSGGYADKKDQPQMDLDNREKNKNGDGILNNAISVRNFSSLSEPTLHKTKQTQTEVKLETAEKAIESFLAKYFRKPPRSISEAIGRMLKIDRCILKLTKYRQSLFNNFKALDQTESQVTKKTKKAKTSSVMITTPTVLSQKKRKTDQQTNTAKKKKKSGVIKNNKQEMDCKSNNSVQKDNEQGKSLECKNIPDVAGQECQEVREKPSVYQINEARKENVFGVIENNKQEMACRSTSGVQKENERVESLEFENIPDTNQVNLLKFKELDEKILVLQVVEDKLVAATDHGKIFFCSLEDGHYIKVLEVCSVPITSLLFIKTSQDYIQMFVGSFELNLMLFTINKFQSHCAEKNINMDDSVQCMENKWDYIFIGGMRGSILRYSLKNNRMEYADKFANNSILVLRATQEGARRILIIGSRNSSICIRDAMTGLHMRILDNEYIIGSPTVYSLILEKNLVYSGTSNHDILVFCFHDGKLTHRLKATDSKGISCLKIVKNLLFASCHNGNIFVYNLQDHTFIGSIEGPGGVILTMEVLKHQVIVGTMSFKFTSIPIPHDILRYKLK